MDTINEALTTQQRIKRSMIMARNRSKIERARERSRHRLADAKKIVERAMRIARQVVRKRVVGERGERYEELSPAEKVEIDKIMQKRKDAIKKIALRLIQQVRKKEFERYKSFYMGKQLDHLHTESVDQDVGKMLYEMIDAAQDMLITEQDGAILEAKFGHDEDYELYKSYFVESLALEDGDSEMAMLRVTLLEKIDTELLVAEESVPKDPKLWARAVAWAKRNYDVYPSKWANQGAAKWYKKHGGEWGTLNEILINEIVARRQIGLKVSKHSAYIRPDPFGKSTLIRKERQSRTRLRGAIPGGKLPLGKVRKVGPSGEVQTINVSPARLKSIQLQRIGITQTNMPKGGGGVHYLGTPETSRRRRVRAIQPRVTT